MRAEQADIWLGFSPSQVAGYFTTARSIAAGSVRR